MSEPHRTLDDLIERWERDHLGWKVERHYLTDPASGVVIQVREDATDDTLSGTGTDLDAALMAVNKIFESRSRL